MGLGEYFTEGVLQMTNINTVKDEGYMVKTLARQYLRSVY